MKTKVKLAGATRVKGGVVLSNPVRISEDEADAIISQRRLAEKKRIPLDAVDRPLPACESLASALCTRFDESSRSLTITRIRDRKEVYRDCRDLLRAFVPSW